MSVFMRRDGLVFKIRPASDLHRPVLHRNKQSCFVTSCVAD